MTLENNLQLDVSSNW